MGIMAPVARIILKEHIRKPIVGSAAFIGRQTIPLTYLQAVDMIKSEGLEVREVKVKEDRETRSAIGNGFIDERTFFNLFTSLDITFIDVTDYEGAEIVHDMCEPLPANLRERFDFVWNGSCLDNIFDAASAQRHSCELLREGGRIITMEMANSHFGSYCFFSQAWFHDFYAINEFVQAEVYSCVFKSHNLWNGPYEIYRPDSESSSGLTFPLASRKDPVVTVAIATKGPYSTVHLSPVQLQYRPKNEDLVFKNAYERFNVSQPLLGLQPKSRIGLLKKAPKGFVKVCVIHGVKGGYVKKPRHLRVLQNPFAASVRFISRKLREFLS